MMKKQFLMILSLLAMNSLYAAENNNDNRINTRFIASEAIIPARDLHPIVEPVSRGRSNSFTPEVAVAVANRPVGMDQEEAHDIDDLVFGIQHVAVHDVEGIEYEHNLEDFNNLDFSFERAGDHDEDNDSDGVDYIDRDSDIGDNGYGYSDYQDQ